MNARISQGQERCSCHLVLNLVKVIGEEVVSWKRILESWIISQSSLVKFNLSLMTLSVCTMGGLALAGVGHPPESSFEVYQSIRTAEAVVKGVPGVSQPDTAMIAASAFDTADDYVREIFGTPVPNHISAAEEAVRQPLKSPLPDDIKVDVVDNGPPPVPGVAVAAAPANLGSPFMSSRRLMWPMRSGYVSSRFGMRWGRMHHGTDIAAPMGTPIMAAADGKVIFSGWESGYGQLIVVDHGNGVKTKYGHCSSRSVSVGQTVKQGTVIGRVGTTGHATGPHLHYEVVREGVARNPEQFTRRR